MAWTIPLVVGAGLVGSSCSGGGDAAPDDTEPMVTIAAATSTDPTTTTATTSTTVPATQTVRGVFDLRGVGYPFGDAWDGIWTGCVGLGGYEDFGPGMAVVIRDADGTIIATGATRSLGSDLLDGDPFLAAALQGFVEDVCRVVFEIPGVPDSTFYTIEVGRRGNLTFSRDELATAGWTVEMSLG